MFLVVLKDNDFVNTINILFIFFHIYLFLKVYFGCQKFKISSTYCKRESIDVHKVDVFDKKKLAIYWVDHLYTSEH